MTTLDPLLATLQSHLSAQTSHLPMLHERLGLPPTALETELDTLQDKLIATVEDQIDVRRREVSDWLAKCEAAENQWMQYVSHLGGFVKERDKQGADIEEIKKENVLPRRWEMGRKAGERVKQLYQAKVDTLRSLNSRLLSLANVLGDTFFPLEILHAKDDGELIDVTPEHFAKIEKELARGKSEFNNRLHALSNAFCQLDWLYSELGLSPDDTSVSTPSEFDMDSDPFLVSTPTPPSRSSSSIVLPSIISMSSDSTHRSILIAFMSHIASNPDPLEADNVRFLNSLSPPVEPTVDFLQWADKLLSSLTEEKERREARIQTLYDQLEPIWVRLGITTEDIDSFVDHNRGTSLQTLQSYEDELDRMVELKKERMVEFVEAARVELGRLHEELLDSPDQDDPYSYSDSDEEVLGLLEERIIQLKTELKEKSIGGMLSSVKKYFAICEEEKELAHSAQDQTRLLGRGRDPGRLLREEKMRKRVKKEKPRILQDLLIAIPAWEDEYQRPFLALGESMLEILQTAQEAEEANVAGSKRKAPPGGGRAITPGPPPTRGVTPTPASRPRGVTPSSVGKPGMTTPGARSTSTAHTTTGTKRMKLMDYATTSTHSTANVHATHTNTKSTPFSNASNRTHQHSNSTSKSGFGFSTQQQQQQHPRTVTIPVPKPGTAQHALGHGRLPTAAMMPYPAGTTHARDFSSSSNRQMSYQYGKKRESFRPRPSIDSMGMSTTSTIVVGGSRQGAISEGTFSKYVGGEDGY